MGVLRVEHWAERMETCLAGETADLKAGLKARTKVARLDADWVAN